MPASDTAGQTCSDTVLDVHICKSRSLLQRSLVYAQPSGTNAGNASGQDKPSQDKTRQDKTRQDKTRQDKTRQDKTGQGNLQSIKADTHRQALW